MVICIEQWHARIGLFVARSTKGKFKVYNGLNIVSYKVFALIIMLLLTHGDMRVIQDLNIEQQIIFHVVIGM